MKQRKGKIRQDELRQTVEYTIDALKNLVAEWQHLLPTPEESRDDHKGRSHGWTPQRIRNLGTTTDVETAANILGYGRSKAYELARDAHYPVIRELQAARLAVHSAPMTPDAAQNRGWNSPRPA